MPAPLPSIFGPLPQRPAVQIPDNLQCIATANRIIPTSGERLREQDLVREQLKSLPLN